MRHPATYASAPLASSLAFVFALALTLAGSNSSAAAQAARPASASSPKAAPAGGEILTRDQLRACRAQQAPVARQDAEMAREKEAIGAESAEVSRAGDALKEKLATMDKSSAEAVAAFNEETLARNQRVTDLQARSAAFNGRVETMNAERESLRSRCQNRRFLEEDEAALKKEEAKKAETAR